MRGVRGVPGRVSGHGSFGEPASSSPSLENLGDRLTIDEIVKMFAGLNREQVRTVLNFAVHILDAPAPARCGAGRSELRLAAGEVGVVIAPRISE